MSNYRNNDVDRLASMFRALSNPNRLKIFLRLASGRDGAMTCCVGDEVCACVGELGRDLGIVASTVSHHLRELHGAGLIRMERRGQSVECRADPEVVALLARFFGGSERG